MANRDLIFKLRNREVAGNTLPGTALMGEPFVNTFEGVLAFSATTGGAFEASNQDSVFEVGSKLFNSKITNRLSINDNFVISGDTGLISTYAGTSALNGKFLSGTTAGMVLADISDIQGTATTVSGGTNIDVTDDGNFNYGVALQDDISLNSVTATDINGTNIVGVNVTGSTIFSGNTDLTDIFLTAGDITGGTTVSAGSNIDVQQTLTDYEVSVQDDILLSSVTATQLVFTNAFVGTTVTGGTFYSGSTDLSDLFVKDGEITQVTVSAETNISVSDNGSGNYGVGLQDDISLNSVTAVDVNATNIVGTNVTGSTIFSGNTDLSDIFLTSGDVSGTTVSAGANIAVNQTGNDYEVSLVSDVDTNSIKVNTLQVGDPGAVGTTATIYGDLLIVGDAISGFTSDLYIEDNRIELNFNPTASTISTSLGAGISIQDGSGVQGTDAFFDIRGTSTGAESRSFATNLEDIRIRETGTQSSPNGARVIAEFDTLDGGSY